MNIDIENLKKYKVTIPVAAIVVCAIFIWNISMKYADFQDSVATDDEISEMKIDLHTQILEINKILSNYDKRILILEVTNGTMGMVRASETLVKPPMEEVLREEGGL